MTREEKLYSMKMQDLVKVADKLGIKITTQSDKSQAIETILAAEEMNKENEKELKKEEKELETMEENLVPMPGSEKLAELKQEVANSIIDDAVLGKFVKKAQKLITQATKADDGYHITINVNGKDVSYIDKNLQNIRSAIGHIYRGEVEV